MVAIGMRAVRHSVMMLALTLAGGLACGDHLLGLDEQLDEPDTQPVCMVLTGTRGYWDNGDSHLMTDPERGTAGGPARVTRAVRRAQRRHADRVRAAVGP